MHLIFNPTSLSLINWLLFFSLFSADYSEVTPLNTCDVGCLSHSAYLVCTDFLQVLSSLPGLNSSFPLNCFYSFSQPHLDQHASSLLKQSLVQATSLIGSSPSFPATWTNPEKTITALISIIHHHSWARGQKFNRWEPGSKPDRGVLVRRQPARTCRLCGPWGSVSWGRCAGLGDA